MNLPVFQQFSIGLESIMEKLSKWVFQIRTVGQKLVYNRFRFLENLAFYLQAINQWTFVFYVEKDYDVINFKLR